MAVEQMMQTSLMDRVKGKLVQWVKEGQEMTSDLIAKAMTEAADEEAALAMEIIEGKTERAQNWTKKTTFEVWMTAQAKGYLTKHSA